MQPAYHALHRMALGREREYTCTCRPPQAHKIADALSRDVHYTVDEKQKSVLLDGGRIRGGGGRAAGGGRGGREEAAGRGQREESSKRVAGVGKSRSLEVFGNGRMGAAQDGMMTCLRFVEVYYVPPGPGRCRIATPGTHPYRLPASLPPSALHVYVCSLHSPRECPTPPCR